MVSVTACGYLGLAPVKSPSEGIAYAYATVATVRTSASQALQAHTITVETAQKVLADTDTIRTMLDVGEAAVASNNPTTAASSLASATVLIGTLQSFLIAQGVK